LRIVLIYLFLFSLTLFGRENPFFPVDRSSTPSYTTNQVEKLPPFDGVTLNLPNTARILEEVSITFINLDGSQQTETIKIHKAIDWHHPLHVNQNSITNNFKKKQTNLKFKKIVSLKFISFYENYKQLQIHTQDKLLRDFKIPKPERIVLDFKREIDFRSYKFKGSDIFKIIRIGNHDGYYRVVLELDGKYIFNIEKKSYGYLLTLE